MDLFIIKHNYITTDHDGWKHWMETSIISYHSTHEKAKIKLAEVLKAHGLTEETNVDCFSNDEYDSFKEYDICYELVD